ncbi:MAG: hypothetical protein KF819_20380 [Labilithrix sp.]|nr:hypothetical protein [Labilithrix sp.]
MRAPPPAGRIVPFAAFAASTMACALLVGLEDKEALDEPLEAAPEAASTPGERDDAAPASTILASDQAKPWGIAVDGPYVYWTNEGDGTVLRIDHRGGAATFVAKNQPEPHQILVDGEQVVWHNANLANRNGDDAGNELLEIAFVPKGDVGKIVAPGAIDKRRGVSNLRRLAMAPSADTFIFGTRSDEVRRYQRDTESNDRQMQGGLDGRDPTAIAADSTYLYWFLQARHELWRAGKSAELGGDEAGADPALLATIVTNPEIADMVVDEGRLFAVTKSGVVLKIDAADAGAPQVLATGFAFPHAIAQDANNVYFTHGNDDVEGQGQIVMVPKAGGAAKVLAGGLGKLRGVAAGAASDGTPTVFWASYGDGTIRSVAAR